MSESYRGLSAGTKRLYNGAGGVGLSWSTPGAAVTACQWPYGQVTPIDSQIRKMESNGAYRASRAIAWFWLPVMSHIMFKGSYFGATVVCVVGPLKIAASIGFGST